MACSRNHEVQEWNVQPATTSNGCLTTGALKPTRPANHSGTAPYPPKDDLVMGAWVIAVQHVVEIYTF